GEAGLAPDRRAAWSALRRRVVWASVLERLITQRRRDAEGVFRLLREGRGTRAPQGCPERYDVVLIPAYPSLAGGTRRYHWVPRDQTTSLTGGLPYPARCPSHRSRSPTGSLCPLRESFSMDGSPAN